MADSAPPIPVTIDEIESVNWFEGGELLVHVKGEPLRFFVIRMPALQTLAKAFRDWAPLIERAEQEYDAARRRN